MKAFDQATSRVQVEVDGAVVAIKPANLSPAGGKKSATHDKAENASGTNEVRATVANTSHDDINGKSALVESYDEDSGRFVVLVPELDKRLSLKPEKIIFSSGSRLVVFGLAKAAEYNGREVQVLSWNEGGCERYEVKVVGEEGHNLKLKPTNLRLVG